MYKKISIVILSVVMFFTLIPSATFAANTTDTAFAFSVNVNKPTVYIGGRAKQNSTSTYVHVYNVPSVYIRTDVQGYRPSSGTGNNYWTNETIGGTVLLKKGQWFIRQLVYENGGRSARLKLQRVSTNGIVSGMWSPDSVGSYPIVN